MFATGKILIGRLILQEKTPKIEETLKNIPPAACCPLVLLDASLVGLELGSRNDWVAYAQKYMSSAVVLMHLPQNLPTKEHVRRLRESPLIAKPMQGNGNC